MKLLIEVPTWLGDCIMATPAIENLINYYKEDVEVTIVGSYVSAQLFINHPKIKKIVVDDSKKSLNRYFSLYKLAKVVKKSDMAISFRSSLGSKFFMFFVDAKKKYNFKNSLREEHQVLKYSNFVNNILKMDLKVNDLKIYSKIHKYDRPTLGINPGATYGSAKRWYPSEFAQVAIHLSTMYDIVIFGGPGEIDIAFDIEKELQKANVKNYMNVAGKTSITQLIEKIAGLDLLITNDSGPMHIGAAFKIKTCAIFGPTRFNETDQWNNPNQIIITKNLPCAPCMEKECPLKHHDCMKKITASDLLETLLD